MPAQVDKKMVDFAPIFIVGAPRSGTTLLAVLLDRHSQISIPPETNFFSEFLPETVSRGLSFREERVDAAVSFRRIKDLGITEEELREQFDRYENNYASLFRAILEVYCRKQGKNRLGEKSPRHIEYVPTLLAAFPKAKVLLIVRDGRDVVRSLMKVPWAEPGNPRRFGIFCMEWRHYAILAEKYRRKFSANQFKIVRYEDILSAPEKNMMEICQFVGEQFEPEQLDAGKTSTAVPNWEEGWKGKASQILDPQRVEAWRQEKDEKIIWRMNILMGKSLRYFGYRDTFLFGCPWYMRLLLRLQAIPYESWCREYALLGLRFMRKMGVVK